MSLSATFDNSGTKTASLGKDAKHLANYQVSSKNKRSVARLKLLDSARRILASHDIRSSRTGNRHRTRNCHAVPAYESDIYITLNSDEGASSAGLAGMQTCGSICSCPVCATNKMIEYGQDIRRALIFAEQNNLRPVMMTLTAQHTKQMSLSFFKNNFQAAYNDFQRHGSVRKLKRELAIQHSITSREITHGGNGWHYHMHILYFVPVSSVRDLRTDTDIGSDLIAWWMRSLEKNGLSATEQHALDLSSGKNQKTYLAKLGFEVDVDGDLAFELTGNANKGNTVWDLLTKAHYGDWEAELLYVDYVNEMQGHQWITFSNGFKDLIADIELDIDETPDNQRLYRWLQIDNRTWYAVARLNRISKVIKAAARWRDKHRLRDYLQDLHDEWYYMRSEYYE